MKYVLVVGDGMADYPVPELNGKTPLQVAFKPNMDSIAANGRSGLLKTVPNGMNSGSDTAILSVLGYEPDRLLVGRGALEAAARGIKLRKNDVAFRCNLITEENGLLMDYSAGHITTKEAEPLIAAVQKAFGKPGEIEFFSGLDYRHFLVMHNFPSSKLIECWPPHDVTGAEINSVLPKSKSEKVDKQTLVLRKMILESKMILQNHPINIARRKAGKRPGNMIWFWGGGEEPLMKTFKEKYGLKAGVVSAVDLVKGIGIYAGMQVINVPGATGMYDTNFEGKAKAALEALEENDLVFLHVEAPDEAGHERDYIKKVKAIEDLDNRMLGKLLKGLKQPYAIAVLPDHPTPITVGTHTRDPVPFAIQSPFLTADCTKKFDEISAKSGGFGLVEKDSLVSLLIASGKAK
ncbi:MAG: cofactor-independent phosphoglycerate mutase [Chloroflexota bacterium]|nr:cofactor-independent phosphoglycerate mutase [Candidatus Sulfotelmatobacter sp.]